jgi:hypothetical protein
MSSLRTITGFKERLAGGGARPNLFEVEIPSFPAPITNLWKAGAGQEIDTFKFLCKAAALPASNVAPIDVPFRGRILKVAGDRTFDTWTITIINDEDFKLRSAFELWMNSISKLDNNSGATNPGSYMTDAYVHQLGRGYNAPSLNNGRFSTTNNGGNDATLETNITPLRTYKFHSIFPTNVSAIDLSYDSSDTIEEYSVEFQVQYWTAGKGANKNDATNTLIS